MAINQNDKVIRQIMVENTPHEICAKYLNEHTYDDIHNEIQNYFDEVNNKVITPIYSNPQLDFESTSNNSDCFGYVGTLKSINVNGDLILIDSISVYVREGNASPNLDTPVWCRLLKFVNDAWEIVYQSTESKTIRNIEPETLFSFKMKAKDDANKLIKSTDKIAIVYVDSEDAQVLSGVKLGFKAIVGTRGGLQNVLANNSLGHDNWCPAFIIGYLSMADEPKNVVTIEDNQTISGAKNFTSHIGINGNSYIRSNIDPGELKVCRPNTDYGFIIRTSGDKNVDDLYQLQLLTTNGISSYQYNFPKASAVNVIPVKIKIDGKICTASMEDGIVDLGNNYFEDFKEVTYVELIYLIDTCSLVKGRRYRIIDYVTKTTQEDTTSAEKPFDIIVTALSHNLLDENAKVCHPKGIRKTYGGSLINGTLGNGILKSATATPYNLTESELPLNIKNVIHDYEREKGNVIQNNYTIVNGGYTVNASAGTLNVKIAPRVNSARVVGVEICDSSNTDIIIDCDYHLSDVTTSNTNFIGKYYVSVPSDGSYVVKIIFIKPENSSSEVNIEIQNYSGHYFNENDLSKWVIKYDVHNDINKYLWADTENGKGVIYYMKDEFDNECPYDFKNIKFKRTKQWVDDNNLREPNDELKFSETEKYFYTFDWNGTDDSLCKGNYKCEQNKIERLLSGKQQQLNNNIFLGNGNSNNKIGANSKNNVIGVDTYNNEFGVNFQNNIILKKFTYNSVGNGFKNNIIRTTFRYNNIGHLVSDNEFKSSFNNNIVRENVKYNTFNGVVEYNTFGAVVQNNLFNDVIYYSNIGTNLTYCSLVPGLYRVTIDNGILNGTENSPIDLSNILVNNKLLIDEIVNKKENGSWSNEGIMVFKGNDEKYHISSESTVKYAKEVSINGGANLEVEAQLSPNIYYNIINAGLANIIFVNSVSGEMNNYMFQISVSTSENVPTPIINLPNDIKWASGKVPTFKSGKTYQISVINKLGVFTEY